ncbi:hypothetical protein CVT26_004525, partial [Gymnopilus dilepis]
YSHQASQISASNLTCQSYVLPYHRDPTQRPHLLVSLLPLLPKPIFKTQYDCSQKHQHKHFNTLLNGLKTKSTSSSHPSSPISYEHLYLTDSFYPAPEGGGGGGKGDKVRVTRDTNTGQLVECVRKVRLGDLNVYCPKREADWRVSVNLEIPMPHPVGSASHKRVKDRLSYSHEEFKIDLTQVTATNSPNAPPQILHELELEIARPEFLLATALKRNDASAPEHERAAFDELIRAFVNNARILVRNAVEGW